MPTNSCYDQKKKRRSKLEQSVLGWALDNAVGFVTRTYCFSIQRRHDNQGLDELPPTSLSEGIGSKLDSKYLVIVMPMHRKWMLILVGIHNLATPEASLYPGLSSGNKHSSIY